MSDAAVKWALELDIGDSKSRFILIGLANCHNAKTKVCCPSIASLARYARCAERTISRKLRELSDAGHVRIDARYSRSGGRLSSTYVLAFQGGDTMHGGGDIQERRTPLAHMDGRAEKNLKEEDRESEAATPSRNRAKTIERAVAALAEAQPMTNERMGMLASTASAAGCPLPPEARAERLGMMQRLKAELTATARAMSLRKAGSPVGASGQRHAQPLEVVRC